MVTLLVGFIGNALAYVMPAKAAQWAARGVILLAVVGALYAAYSFAYDNGRDDERAKWEAAAEIIEDADAIADAEALDVAHETKDGIDATNQRAADVAAKSGDPLDAVSKRLREEGARRGGEATR